MTGPSKFEAVKKLINMIVIRQWTPYC